MPDDLAPEPTRHLPEYFVLEDFLGADDHARLVELAVASIDTAAPSMVTPGYETEGRRDDTLRRSRTVFDVSHIWPLFEQRLLDVLPVVRAEIGVGWFPVAEVERQLSVHGDGDFFTVHNDSGGQQVASRTVTFVYYFGVGPKAYDGGELWLYDGVERDGFVHAGEVHAVIEPLDNRIVFFPSATFHEVRPVRSSHPGPEGLRFTVHGWYRTAAPTPAPIRVPGPDELASLCKRLLPRYTEAGYLVTDTPPAVHERLVTALHEGRSRRFDEPVDRTYHAGGAAPPAFVDLSPLKEEILRELQPLHERWSGVELVPSAAYGVREYRPGNTLRMHVDRFQTHVISSIVNLEADDARPWPLHLEDHEGTVHEVVVRPGQMILYESATCPHGRPTPLEGSHHSSLFLHYRPATGWDFTVESLLALADAPPGDDGAARAERDRRVLPDDESG